MSNNVMLKIKNLNVEVDEKKILKGINLEINEGEVHAIMGPNGSGKSTLSYLLAGKAGYNMTSGSIAFYDKEISAISPEERAHMGIFLAMQYPVEIPGVTCTTFIKTALNAIKKANNEDELSAAQFLELIREKQKYLDIPDEMLRRSLNVSFSGGEKKKFEMLQMAIFNPKFAILDETDSGLDIDALKLVSKEVNRSRSSDKSILIITHYQRLLDYVEPDFVHILSDGKINRSGDKSLAKELEKDGYKGLVN